MRPWERHWTLAVEFEDRGQPCWLQVEYGGEKGLGKSRKVGFGQISVWRKGILREGKCRQFTLVLWVYEGEEEEWEIVKER